tara:strand:+ start:308 stop:478 length:171 start_codon:yes stop_codon:yes gene_type:complete
MRSFVQLWGALAFVVFVAQAVLADEHCPPCGEVPEPDYSVVGAPQNLWVITQEGFV